MNTRALERPGEACKSRAGAPSCQVSTRGSHRVADLITATLLALMAASCIPTGPRFTRLTAVPQDKAAIYLYRRPRILGCAGSPEVRVQAGDAIYGVEMKNGSYVAMMVDPGIISIFGGDQLNLSVQPGNTYFVEWGLGGKLSVHDATDASRELAHCGNINESLVVLWQHP